MALKPCPIARSRGEDSGKKYELCTTKSNRLGEKTSLRLSKTFNNYEKTYFGEPCSPWGWGRLGNTAAPVLDRLRGRAGLGPPRLGGGAAPGSLKPHQFHRKTDK